MPLKRINYPVMLEEVRSDRRKGEVDFAREMTFHHPSEPTDAHPIFVPKSLCHHAAVAVWICVVRTIFLGGWSRDKVKSAAHVGCRTIP